MEWKRILIFCCVEINFLNLYFHQWNGMCSNYFGTTNGICQGSVISPVLYCICQDEQITRPQTNGIECWVGQQKICCLSYADDLTLLCPTANELQNMTNLCEMYGNEYGVQNNAAKCVHYVQELATDLKTHAPS